MKYFLYEDGVKYNTVECESMDEALILAKNNVDRCNYNDCVGTLWIDVKVYCEETDESEYDTVTLHEKEPQCIESEHCFEQSYALFGGLKENTGVWGSGGGVIIHTVCRHCGCKRVHDTWAQRRDTGEQGLESISYEENVFSADELENAFGG